MMLIEASMLPFPSELPLMAIGMQAQAGNMDPTIWFIVSLAAIFIWATVNYTLWYTLWDIFFLKYGKYFFIKQRAYLEAKRLFEKNENFYTFYGRLVPLVRQLMSLPAGMVCMPYWRFMVLTLCGSGIWHAIVISIWYIIQDNKSLAKTYLSTIHIILFTVWVLYIIWRNKTLIKHSFQHIQRSIKKKKTRT